LGQIQRLAQIAQGELLRNQLFRAALHGGALRRRQPQQVPVLVVK
jgi:hypothetical protein